ncbi:MAG: prepilin peptidase [Thermogutta sp.]
MAGSWESVTRFIPLPGFTKSQNWGIILDQYSRQFELVANLGETVILAWFFVTGSVLGSFLNVVIYRVPRGLSLVHPPSRCPVCLHPIRWHDNIPILGWILLKGRCRDCGTQIPKRYPLIEALAGLDILLIAARTGNWHWVPMLDSLLQKGELYPAVILTVVGVGVSLSLLAAGLILFDGARVPPRFWTVALLLVLIGNLSIARLPRSGEAPSHVENSGETAAVPPHRNLEVSSETGLRQFFGRAGDRLLSLILALAGGILLDFRIGRDMGGSCVSRRPTSTGADADILPPEQENRRKRADNEKLMPAEQPGRPSTAGGVYAAGWEYSFACTVCGWTIGRTTDIAIMIVFLAAVTAMAFWGFPPRSSRLRPSHRRPLRAPTAPGFRGDDPKRIRSILMLALWLFFLAWVVIR